MWSALDKTSFPRLSNACTVTTKPSAASLSTCFLLMSVQELVLGVLMVREKTHGRIERTGVSDARKAHFDPLAKQAGEKCAF